MKKSYPSANRCPYRNTGYKLSALSSGRVSGARPISPGKLTGLPPLSQSVHAAPLPRADRDERRVHPPAEEALLGHGQAAALRDRLPEKADQPGQGQHTPEGTEPVVDERRVDTFVCINCRGQ